MKQSIHKYEIEQDILAITGIAINSGDRVFDNGKTLKWYMRPKGKMGSILGLPLRSYIENAYDCDDMNRQYKVWLVDKNAKDYDHGGPGGASGLAIPCFMVHVKVNSMEQSHWVLMCLTTDGWRFLDYDGQSIKLISQSQITDFYNVSI